MKIGIITNIPSPYKTIQINEFCNIKESNITVYYTEPNNKKIKWEEIKANFKQVSLKQIKLMNKLGFVLNKDIKKIIKEEEVLILSGYDQLSIIYASILCRIYKKPYIIVFDGISKYKLSEKNNFIKTKIKKLVINGSYAVMANGKIGRNFFEQLFNYPSDKIYNQYLSIDYKTINNLLKNKLAHREYYRNKYDIGLDKKVVLYSGRLIDKKNVESIIKAVAKLNRDDIEILITGGGELEEKIKKLSKQLNVDITITGFLNKQEDLFKHYFAADLLVLPSKDEPWGLVVNEAMTAGLPVLVSDICGCADDLVIEGENGYLLNHKDVQDICDKIEIILYNNDTSEMGMKSMEIIKEWTCENSRKSLEDIINKIKNR